MTRLDDRPSDRLKQAARCRTIEFGELHATLPASPGSLAALQELPLLGGRAGEHCAGRVLGRGNDEVRCFASPVLS